MCLHTAWQQEKHMPEYRISRGRRNEIPSRSEFEAVDDTAANVEFDRRTKDPANAWDRMSLARIDQREKLTPLSHND
jgi:hypothetical protein